MKAVIVKPGEKDSVHLEDVPRPTLSSSNALLKIKRVGIDGTDTEINSGSYGECPTGSDYLILGHECLAVVEDIEGSSSIQKGDLVVPTVRRPDDCPNCMNGEPDMCLKGEYKEHGIRGLHGFASEFGVTDPNFLIKIPQDLENIGVLLEPVSVAEKGIYHTFKIQERLKWTPRKALVLGSGPLGLLTTFLLRLKGLEVSTVARGARGSLKSQLVERAGAEYVSTAEKPLNTLGKFDIIMEVTGVSSVAVDSQQLLNANGVMCFLGVYPPSTLSLDVGKAYTDLVLGNRTYFGSVNANKRDFEIGVSDIRQIEKNFPAVLRDMITKTVPLSEYKTAFYPDKGDIKILLDLSAGEKETKITPLEDSI